MSKSVLVSQGVCELLPNLQGRCTVQACCLWRSHVCLHVGSRTQGWGTVQMWNHFPGPSHRSITVSEMIKIVWAILLIVEMVGIHLLWQSVQKRCWDDCNQRDVLMRLRKCTVHVTLYILHPTQCPGNSRLGLLCDTHETKEFTLGTK